MVLLGYKTPHILTYPSAPHGCSKSDFELSDTSTKHDAVIEGSKLIRIVIDQPIYCSGMSVVWGYYKMKRSRFKINM